MLPIATYKLYRNVTVSLFVAVVLLVGWIAFFRDTRANTTDQEFVQELFELANEERANADLSEFQVDKKLSDAAYEKAVDMIRNDYFAHTSPEGKTPWYWVEQQEYEYIYAGENLAINFTTPSATHSAWMNSEKHRENIMSPNFEEIGIAEASGTIDGERVSVIVVMFGREVQF